MTHRLAGPELVLKYNTYIAVKDPRMKSTDCFALFLSSFPPGVIVAT